jgi:hypothetical protein
MLDLPANALALALFSFNLGVELGQLAIVAVFLPVAFALRKRSLYHLHTRQWGSVAILALSLVWFGQRTLGDGHSFPGWLAALRELF